MIGSLATAKPGLALVLAAWLAAAARGESGGVPLAWIRFDDAAERFEGTAYRWLGERPVRTVFDVKPSAGIALELLWGSKNDDREALLVVNGTTNRLRNGGYQGFRWLRHPLPADVGGDRCEVALLPVAGASGKPAFVAEIRLVESGSAAAAPAAAPRSHRATLLDAPAPPPADGEAFPAMRAVWDRAPAVPAQDPRFRQAEKNARLANEAWFRSRRFIDGWLAHADPKTGLIPRNLRESNYWNGRDAGADNYPFMVLTASMTDRELLNGRLLDMLRTETRLTCRVDRLPDDYSFAKQGWRREQVDLDAIIFDGAEYVKDGLLPITEWMGPGPWSERMTGIIEDIWKHASVETPSGRIPTRNFEVNGDLLQACSRLFWFTGERRYLDWAIRLGDYYLCGTNHPTRDLASLQLGDHSCEVLNGLSELYAACAHAAPEKRKQYAKPLHELYDRILEVGRNEHGLLYLRVHPKTGEHSKELTDNWGYNLDGLYTAWLLDGTTAYRDAVRKALGALKEHYTGRGGMCQSGSADGYADSIEGAITLLNLEPDASAADWIDTEIRTMWGRQKADGVIEGWHGDGNSARTSLMYALWKTQGLHVEPWRADVRIGAVREGGSLFISLAADRPWSGRIRFDRPRHREILRLPLDYPRINKFPEWFTVQPGVRYAITGDGGGRGTVLSSGEATAGFAVSVKAGGVLQLTVGTVAPQS